MFIVRKVFVGIVFNLVRTHRSFGAASGQPQPTPSENASLQRSATTPSLRHDVRNSSEVARHVGVGANRLRNQGRAMHWGSRVSATRTCLDLQGTAARQRRHKLQHPVSRILSPLLGSCERSTCSCMLTALQRIASASMTSIVCYSRTRREVSTTTRRGGRR